MAPYRRASPQQIARVLDLAEITGITVPWLAAWYALGYPDRSLSEMDRDTAKALITYVSHWPVRVQTQETRHDSDGRRGSPLPRS